MVKIDVLEGETELSQYMRLGVYRIGRDYASSSEAYKQPQTGGWCRDLGAYFSSSSKEKSPRPS